VDSGHIEIEPSGRVAAVMAAASIFARRRNRSRTVRWAHGVVDSRQPP